MLHCPDYNVTKLRTEDID